ncbi:capsule assembly Wzi family protein [Thalassomonas actiniarum]|uniref:Capsule assembly Wzi family protein n=1 Tax=Thalassomonas actiniarum TaxID=485447 RepID=A0AAE9YTP8_9GAMM|nr:capsule assembly Wzi family protein [Thalassomonas actiniarum]WDE00229.1 capsule assembly Wzi family protein [Thalassomonas actiniarum]
MKLFCALFACASLSSFVQAAPWVEADNIYLRADIQLLSDHDVIKAPINRYPLMWADIAADLDKVDFNILDKNLDRSYQRVVFHLNQAKKSSQPASIKVAAATDRPKFKHFGDTQSEKTEITSKKTFVGSNFAAHLEIHKVSNAIDDKSFRLDGSYLAYKLGNWNVIGGAVPMWWGPGWDTALLMSTNARPIPGISLNRQQAVPFDTPWLSWLGPWSFTTFIGQMEDRGRAIPNTRLWSSRLSLKPFSSLELGLSRSTMWGGDDRGNGFSDFWDIVIPNESDNKINNEIDVNDLGSVDLRWNTSVLGQNVGVYYEMGFEDYGISSVAPSKRSHLGGIDADFFLGDNLYSVYFEASDTYHAECACVYEHDIYRTGYRYRGKDIGSTYGSNASSITLGVIAQPENDNYWQASVAMIELNKNNEDKVIADENLSHQEILELRGGYRFTWAKSRWEVGALARKTEINNKTENDFEASLSWEYKF